MKITMILFILTFLTACTNPEYLAKREEKLAKENSEKVVYYASNYVGMHEVTDRNQLKSLMGMDPSRFEWCAAFVNSILSTKGIPGSESVSNHPLVARSFLKWGEEVTESPRPGDVVVFPRGRKQWQGHVGFFVTSYVDEGNMYYVILGGNQGNEVSYKVYEARKAISVRRWPTDVNTTVMTMN
jgi:uncharacterized protein (TIGR02594 family)